ncbi:fimbrial protein, partial [Aeromonas jandaei]
MKKLLIAAAITISFAGAVNTASASNGDVQFIGAVTSVTCDLQPEVSGAVGATVQLGTVEASGTGSAVEFSLKTVAGQAGCASLTGKTATITWAGNLTSNGLGNTGGKANDAWVELKGVNSKVVGTKITSSTA